MEKDRILVLDDEKVIQQLLVRTFGEDRYHVETAEDSYLALKRIKEEPFDLLITDLKMPGVSGMDVLKEVKNVNPHTEVIIITGYPTIELAVEAVKMGAFDFICKPFDLEHMKTTVGKCLEKQKSDIEGLNQLSQNEEMAAVGRLALRASYDITVPLQIILRTIESLKSDLVKNNKEYESRRNNKTNDRGGGDE